MIMHTRLIITVASLSLFVTSCGGETADPNSAEGTLAESAPPITYNGHDYLFVSSPEIWHQAVTKCQMRGYSLVTIDGAEEEAWLHNREMQAGGGRWWIGFTDAEKDAFWKWVDESASGYVNWAPSEPNNALYHDGTIDQDCAVDNFNAAGEWDDDWCTEKRPFICETNKAPAGVDGSFKFSLTETENATKNTLQWAVNLNQDQLLTIGTCGVFGASNVGDTYLRLKNPFGVEVASNDDACGGIASNISYVAEASGTYVIVAGCSGNSACSGTVTFVF